VARAQPHLPKETPFSTVTGTPSDMYSMRVADGSCGEVFVPTSCGVDVLEGVAPVKVAAMPPTPTWQGMRPSPPTPLSMIVVSSHQRHSRAAATRLVG